LLKKLYVGVVGHGDFAPQGGRAANEFAAATGNVLKRVEEH
jgi:hypothetical protein